MDAIQTDVLVLAVLLILHMVGKFETQFYGKGRSLPLLAGKVDAATHLFRQLLGDRQSQTGSGIGSSGRCIFLGKRLKGTLLKFFRHAKSGVLTGKDKDRHLSGRSGFLYADMHSPSLTVVLDGIAHDILQDLAQVQWTA